MGIDGPCGHRVRKMHRYGAAEQELGTGKIL
jgi:hypothetical protein